MRRNRAGRAIFRKDPHVFDVHITVAYVGLSLCRGGEPVRRPREWQAVASRRPGRRRVSRNI